MSFGEYIFGWKLRLRQIICIQLRLLWKFDLPRCQFCWVSSRSSSACMQACMLFLSDIVSLSAQYPIIQQILDAVVLKLLLARVGVHLGGSSSSPGWHLLAMQFDTCACTPWSG